MKPVLVHLARFLVLLCFFVSCDFEIPWSNFTHRGQNQYVEGTRLPFVLLLSL